MLLNNDQCYNLLGLRKEASIVEIRDAYRRLALECHPDKNTSAKDGVKFKMITDAYQTLRVKNMATSRNFSSVYPDKTSGYGIYEKIQSWNFYLKMFYDVIAYAKKIKYVETVYNYLLKYKTYLITCYRMAQRYGIMPAYHLITFLYNGTNSFISHVSYRGLTRGLLKYLGLHS